MFQAAKLLIPCKNPKFDIMESYSGNIWKPHVWKRAKLMTASFFLIPFLVYLMKFSMSSIFGSNLWFCIIGYKILQTIIEYILIKLCNDQLLMGPNSITCDLMGGIFTFGANDFLEFLKGAFLDLGILMFDRAYLGPFMNYSTEIVDDWAEGVVEYFKKRFFRSSTNNEELRPSENGKEEAKKEEDSYDSSEISNYLIFIEDSSGEQAKESISEAKSEAQISYDESMEVAKDQDKDDADKEKKSEDGGNENEEEAEPPLDFYNGFSRNNVSLWLQIYTVLLMYMFYKETQIGVGYGIPIGDFIYYIFFILFYLPFQTICEIMFLNVNEYYLKCPIHDYTDYLSIRYANRQTRWKGHDRDINPSVNEEFQVLDQWGFSSQYYFTYTLYVTGMILCIFSVQIFTTGPYNPFSDLAAFIIIPATYILCKIVHELTIIVGDLLGIWKVNNDVAVEQLHREQAVPIYSIFEALKGPERETRQKPHPEMAFSKEQWRKVEIEQKQIDLMKPDLQTDRMIAQTYREMFLQLNRPLPVETAYRYLTKSLRQDNREEILAQFTELYGIVKPTNIERRESEEESVVRERELSIEDEKEVGEESKKLMKDWLSRARLRRRLRFQVAKIVEDQRAKICDKCKGSTWLKAECNNEILNIFDSFVREEGEDPNNYNILTWRRYFRRNAIVYTICINCRVPTLSTRAENLILNWLSEARARLANQ